MRRTGMACGIVVLLHLLLVWAAPALAADTGGPIFRDLCTQIPTPITNRVLCWEQTTQELKYWNGSTWVTTAGISAVTSVTGTAGQILAAPTVGPVILSLVNTAVTPGSYGSATQSVALTFDAKGRATAAANVTITGTVPGGTAGGDLSGTYPNPTVAKVDGVAYPASPSTFSIPQVSAPNVVTYTLTPGSLTSVAIGVASPASGSVFEILGTSSTCNGDLTGTIPGLALLCHGSTATPQTTVGATIYAIREETVATIGNLGAAGLFKAISRGAAQGQGVVSIATSHGSGDSSAGLFIGLVDGAGSSFGSYHEARANAATSHAVAVQTTTQNNTGLDTPYSPLTFPGTVGFDIDYIGGAGANRGGAGILVRCGGAGCWDVGLAFTPFNSGVGTVTADIRSDTISLTSIYIAGTHTTGVDISAATISGNAFKSVGFTVSPVGIVTTPQVILSGSTSGTLTVKPAAIAGSNTLTLPAGTTDFSATGGTSQVVKQTSAGGAFTVATVNFTDLAGSLACSQAPALTGNVTTSAGSCATTIAAGVVTNAMLAGSIAASKLIGTDIATVGTITSGTWNATVIAGLYGGTGLSTAAIGDLIYASATTPTWSRLADVAVGSVLVSGGVSTAPAWSTTPSVSTVTTTSVATAQFGGAATSGFFIDATNVAFRLAAASTGAFFWQTASGAATRMNLSSTGLRIGDATGAADALDVVGVINASTGYRIGDAAASGAFLRGNATNFVVSVLTIPNAATTGDTVIATGTNAWGAVTAVAAGSFFRSAGTGTTPVWSTTTWPNSATTGDLLYASATSTYSNLAAVAAGSYLRSAGTGTAPVWSTITLPNALTTGDTVIATGTNAGGVVAAAAIGKVPISQGTGTAWVWSATPTLVTNTGTIPATGITSSQIMLHIGAVDGSRSSILLDSAGTSNEVFGRQSLGTFASPTATATGNVLISLKGGGYDTTNLYSAAAQAAFVLRALNTWSATDNSTDAAVQTTPSGSRTIATVAVFNNATGLRLTANPVQFATTQTTVPTCSSNCGTSPSVAGSDTAWIVTMGATGSPTSGWVLTFNGTWAAAPSCDVTMAKAGMVVGKLPLTVVTTTTTVTVVTNGTAPANGDIYSGKCIGVA